MANVKKELTVISYRDFSQSNDLILLIMTLISQHAIISYDVCLMEEKLIFKFLALLSYPSSTSYTISTLRQEIKATSKQDDMILRRHEIKAIFCFQKA